jgi:D,D-heptose 1,7-bisphosphate phosphatase
MYPGVGNGVKRLRDDGFKVIVITNQSGIGRGFFTEQQLSRIHERMKDDFLHFDVILDGIYYCPHHPDEHCRCRKPNTGLFERAIIDHDIDVRNSFMIGDKILDIGAGIRAGARTILIPEPHIHEELIAQKHLWEYSPDFIASNFSDAVTWILKMKRPQLL